MLEVSLPGNGIMNKTLEDFGFEIMMFKRKFKA
jgi:hypothetical protein